MAKRKPTPEQLAAITDLAKRWGKIVARNAYGADGPAGGAGARRSTTG